MTRLLALLLSFAAAIVVFALMRGPEPATSSPTPATSRAGGDADIARLKGAVRAAPRDVAPRVALASAYLRKARETEDPAYYGPAGELLRAALARRPGDHDALVASASLALARHDFRAALRLARRARATRPEGLAPYPALVDALVELGRFSAAERRLQQLVNMKPGLAAYARVSYLRELHGDLEGAVAAMRRAAAAGGTTRESAVSVRALLGDLELRRGRLGAARAAYLSALAIAPGYAAADEGLARLDAATGDLAGASRRWGDLVERLPVPDHLAGLGEAELAAGRVRAGLRHLARSGLGGALPPGGDAHADAELAVLEADHGSPRRAVLLARRAWRNVPGLQTADALGWALTRSGRPADGLRWARRALALGSADPLFRYHAGMAALQAGRERAGRRQLRVAFGHGLAGWPWQATAARDALAGE